MPLTDKDRAPYTYFECRERERLEHTTVEDAVVDLVESWGVDPTIGLAAQIRAQAPIAVTCFQRDAVTDAFLDRIADHLVTSAVDAFTEEYGDPDGDHVAFTDAAETATRTSMRAALLAFYAQGEVWPCTPAHTIVLEAADVETMVRAVSPKWFETPSPLTAPPV